MSTASDKYEKDVAKYINGLPNIQATRPSVGTDYPDVLIKYNGRESWLEVKMSHTDNLANPRVFYKNKSWDTTYKTPAAKEAIDILNSSSQAANFIKNISQYSGIPLDSIIIATTKSQLKEPGAVPNHIMKTYFNRPGVNRYIANKENMDIGSIVISHYTKGKTKPAYYMQAGDDFYKISNQNPFDLSMNIPLISGFGDFKVRISTRTEFYEVQAEIKIKKMNNSAFSVKPGTRKKNPFQ
jgi:hypothetical protein